MASTLGVVVVGVGMAGKVRIRDLLQSASSIPELSRLKLKGFVSRRELQMEGVQQCTLEEALQNPDVHVILICTENDLHEPTARKALEAGKHVLVEYPLALAATQAQQLKENAREKGQVCYEEDIALLTDSHLHVKELLKTKPNLVEGDVWLEGSFNGWIEKIERSGSPFHSSISQIHRLMDCFGELKPVDATIVRDDKSVKSVGVLQTADGGLVNIRVLRELLDKPKYLSGYTFKFSDDSVIDSQNLVIPQQEPKKPGLFLQDLIQFMDVVEGKLDEALLNRRTVRSLEVADQLFELAKNNNKSTL